MAFPKETFINKAKLEGRSEKFIILSIRYIDRLESHNFPVLFSIPHLAIEVGMQSDYIRYLINQREARYNYFLLQKKDKLSAPREIMAPIAELKYIQRWININILQKAKYNCFIKGFVPGTSIRENADVHREMKYLLKIDLLKFFDCIDEYRVYGIFRDFGYVKNLAWDLAKICTAKHRPSYWESFSNDHHLVLEDLIVKNPSVLPQGAPTSPLLANLVASRLDKRIGMLSIKEKFNYSRYADDLCFSSNVKGNIPSIQFLTQMIEEEGFHLNKAKVGYSKRGMKQYVTGLSITHGISIEKSKRKEIFSHLYFAKKFGLESHFQKLKQKGLNKTNYQNWLLGNISFQYSINKSIGAKMFDLYNKINWSIDPDN